MTKNITVSLERVRLSRLTPEEKSQWRDAVRHYRETVKAHEWLARHYECIKKIAAQIAGARCFYSSIIEIATRIATPEDVAEIKAALTRAGVQEPPENALDWLKTECPGLFQCGASRIPPKPRVEDRGTWDCTAPNFWMRIPTPERIAVDDKVKEAGERSERFCQENGVVPGWDLADQLGVRESLLKKWIERGLPIVSFDDGIFTNRYYNPIAVNKWIEANTKSPKRVPIPNPLVLH